MPLGLLLVLFIAVPLAELYVIVQVAQAIEILPTLAILLADSVAGALLLRSQGRSAWRRFGEAMGSGRVPHREILDGALVIFGAALLLTPGFLTDLLGLALLVPPTRALARRLVARLAARRLVLSVSGAAARRTTGRRRPDPPAAGAPFDVEGTATEQPPSEPGRLPR